MQIYVCVKHVPDSAANIHILDETKIDEDVAFLLNPYDEHAVTEAVNIRNQFSGSEIVVVTCGRKDAENTLRSAMAMGADRGILIAIDGPCDAVTTARALASAIREDGSPGIILTGKESIDAEGMQTQFRIGAILDMPVVTNASKLTMGKGKACVTCELSGGQSRTFEADLPCVIGAGRGLNTPGYPTLPDIMKARKKPVSQIPLASLGVAPSAASTKVVKFSNLSRTRSPKPITGNPGQIASQIIKIIKKAGGPA